MSGTSPPGGRCRSICRASGSSCRRPTTCRCCGGSRLAKIGEVVTETLDVVPRRWFVRQTVREKFTCRDCETISEPPAPFHVIPRGRIGASLLAMILFEKYGAHQPLNRQSERYAREGVDLDLSTMADHVGAGAAALAPLHELIRGHVLAAERLHGDDTTVPVLAKGKTITGRLWAYVRDDRPFGQGQTGPPAVLFHYSRDRRGEHPEAASGRLCRDPAGRCLQRLRRPLRADTRRRCRDRSPLLGPCPAKVLRARRPRPSRQGAAGTARRRGGPPDRRDLRPRARDQRPRRPPTGSPTAASTQLPWSATLEAWMKRERAEALPPCRGRQGHGLHAQAMARLHPLPRRRADLPDQQRGRTSAARRGPRPKVMALRRLRSRRPAARRACTR